MNYEIIPLLMAEDATEVSVQSDLGVTIVEHQNSQHSSEGFADHGQGRIEPTTSEEKGWRDSFLDAIEQSKPIQTDKERMALDEARERQAEREEAEEQAENEEQEAEEQEEAEATESPLNSFDPESVRQWAEYLNLDENDLQNPKIAAMLAQQMQEAVDQDTAEAQRAQQNPGQPGQPYQPSQQDFDSYVTELHRVVDNPQINDPVMMRAFTDGLSHFLGDGSPESVKNAEGLGRLLTAGGLNLMSTAVPAIVQHYLPQMIDAYLPGMRQMMEDANNHNAWEAARNEVSRALPSDINSPEFAELRESVLKVAPWLTSVQWKDAQNRPLHPSHPEAIRQSAIAFARIAAGQTVTPETIKKAQETARREAMGHNRRITASRSLASGKSRNSFVRESRNDFLEAIQSYNTNQHGNFEEK